MAYLLPFRKNLYITMVLIFIITIISTCRQSDTRSSSGNNGGQVDLYPGQINLTNSGDKYVNDGLAVSITLPIQNLGINTVTPAPSFNVQFYMSENENLGMDRLLEKVSVEAIISGNSTYSLVTNITIPDDLNLNQCVYIWADIDNSDLINSEIDENNNQSSISSALCLLVFDNENVPGSFEMVFETFPPTGSNPSPVPNTVITLYDSTGTSITSSFTDPYSKVTRTGGDALPPGTYYIKIENFSPGAYGLSVRSFETMPIPYFGSTLSSAGDDPYEPDDNHTLNVPSSPVSIRVGASLNRYIDSVSIDWMEMVLP